MMRERRQAVALPSLYARWQELLAAAFFENAAGKPVVFFTDDDELARLWGHGEGDGQQAAALLAQAVGQLVDVRKGPDMFDRLLLLERIWRNEAQQGPPPTLPLLAMSVLAATRMVSDSEGAAHNYYVRLVNALMPAASAPERDQAHQAISERRAFVAVAAMWQCLDRWLDGLGDEAGLSTIRGHPEWTRIGYPLSQALLRRSDRASLTQFFAAMNVAEDGVPAPGPLLEYLQLWASRPRGLSKAFENALSAEDLESLIEPLVWRLASAWDGIVIAEGGQRRLEVRVAVDLESWSCYWAIPFPGGVGEAVLSGTIDGTPVQAQVSEDPGAALFIVTGLPVPTGRSLREGFRLGSDAVAAIAAPSQVVVAAEHPETASWVAVPAITPFESHLVLAAAGVSADVEEALREAADPGWRAVPQPAGQVLLAGFAIFEKVIFSDPSRLSGALARMPGLRATGLRPDPTARPRLVNGLPLARIVTRDAYLEGGEPDLLLPSGTEPRAVPAALDGVAQEPPFRATSFPIPLQRGGTLPLGRHEVDVDGELLSFRVLPGNPETASKRQPEKGWAATLAGAGGGPEPVLVRRGCQQAWMLHRNGLCTSIAEPGPPQGLHQRVPELVSLFYELEAPHEAAWLATQRRGQWNVVRLRAHMPDFARPDPASLAIWNEVGQHGPPGDALWRLFVQAAERQHGR